MIYGHSRLLLHDALVIWATLFSMSMVGVGSNPALANNWRPLGDLKLSWSGHALYEDIVYDDVHDLNKKSEEKYSEYFKIPFKVRWKNSKFVCT